MNAFTALACLPTGISFTDQASIDQFQSNYPGCTQIEGEVHISGNDITNLLGLHAISAMPGGLTITICGSLQDLDGLENLEAVGFLNITGNPVLTDLAALSSLSSITDFLILVNNAQLQHFTGLNNVPSVGSFCQVVDNAALLDMGGLNSLQRIGTFFQIKNNALLTDMTGLNQLDSIGEFLQMDNNASMTSFAGMNELKYIGGYFQVTAHPVLSNLQDLIALKHISGFLQITEDPMLASLSGLDSLDADQFGQLTIFNCASLSECAVRSVCDFLSGTGLTDIHGNLAGCNSVPEVEAACVHVGVEETSAASGNIYPNPVNDRLNIDLAGSRPEAAGLFNISGELVLSLDLSDGHTSFSTASLDQGVYMLQVKDEKGGLVNKRITKL